MGKTESVQSVAFIGLGRMGTPMAAHILKAGIPLIVWNRTPQKADPLIASGAKWAKTPREAATNADVVISSLMDDEAVLSIVNGRNGVLAGLRPSAIHIGASTISPALSAKLERLHQKTKTHYVAGPVLGRPSAAEAGRLMALLAGVPHIIDRIRPIVSTYAPVIMVAGERPGQASVAKLVANFLLASALDMIGQSLALAEKSDLDRKFILQMLSGFFAVPAVQEYVARIAERDFDPAGFDIAGGLKDMELMIGAAKAVNLKLTNAESVRKKIRVAMKTGLRGKDWSSFTEVDRR